MDEPTSLLALGIATLVFVERAFDRWMQWKERKRNGGNGIRGATKSERGAAGNGVRLLTERLDRLEAAATTSRKELWSKLTTLEVLCARLEERIGKGVH